MSRRGLCVWLCLCVLWASLPAFAQEGGTYAPLLAGFDGTNTGRAWETNAFFQRMAEKTGLYFRFQQYMTAADWEKAKEAMQPGGELPDALFKANLSRTQEQALFDRGVLIDLMPYLKDNCPHLWQILEDHPDYLEEITLPGGQIVSLPYISTAPAQNAMWINKTWLSRLKLSAPEDRETLEQVLRAFKTRDPNQNGRQDEIPLAFLGPFDLKFLAHMFGLVFNDYNLFLDETGEARFAPLEPGYEDFVRWCADMYREGILDPDGFYLNDALRQVTSTSQAQTYGILLTTDTTNLFPAEWAKDYEILLPMRFEGERKYRSLTGHVYQGTFALTANCGEPEKLLQWADVLYTPEGARLMAVGRENEDYVVDGDGTWRVLESARNNSSFVAQTLIVDGTTPPGISADEFELSYSEKYLTDMIRQRYALDEYCVRPFPQVALSAQQKSRVAELQNEIGYLVDTQLARWVSGEEPLTDGAFDGFRERLEEKGLQEFLAIWQEALEKAGRR